MRRVFASTGYGKLFDALVTAEDIERGKPDPMCYLAAAAKLGSEPRAVRGVRRLRSGLKAAGRRGMFTVGLLTTFPESEILPLCDAAIPDFSNAGNLRQCCFRKMGKPPRRLPYGAPSAICADNAAISFQHVGTGQSAPDCLSLPQSARSERKGESPVAELSRKWIASKPARPKANQIIHS